MNAILREVNWTWYCNLYSVTSLTKVAWQIFPQNKIDLSNNNLKSW